MAQIFQQQICSVKREAKRRKEEEKLRLQSEKVLGYQKETCHICVIHRLGIKNYSVRTFSNSLQSRQIIRSIYTLDLYKYYAILVVRQVGLVLQEWTQDGSQHFPFSQEWL